MIPSSQNQNVMLLFDCEAPNGKGWYAFGENDVSYGPFQTEREALDKLLTWTTEPPKERGYYWLRCDDYKNREDAKGLPRVVHVWGQEDGTWFADRPDFCDRVKDLENAEWFGPLQPPE